jgi:protocatechuate 3,4-dioxygenase beta subunit
MYTPDLGRRRALAVVSACAATLVLPRALAQAASCAVTEDAGEGPFYFDPSLVRSDVTSGRLGAPLEFAVQITRARDCAPLTGVRLDLWQADALGLYSGYRDQPGVGGVPTEPTVGATFLRGTQFADADGWVRFKTVYPSWYGGRTPHIHFKVLIDEKERIASQIFFPDEINAEVFENWDPYREHIAKRTSFNHNDTFLDRNSDGRTDGVFCAVERYDRSAGLAAKAVVTVDT